MSFDERYESLLFTDGELDDGGEGDEEILNCAATFTIRTPVLRSGDIPDNLTSGRPVMVTEESPERFQAVLYEFARNLKREMHYDSIPFQDPTYPRVSRVPWEAWIWGSGGTLRPLPVGAALFSHEVYQDRPEPIWTLSWVWMHPHRRRKGYLRTAWPMFQRHYGEHFDLGPPLSEAMTSFVANIGHQQTRHLPTW